jgi:Rad3-related DNA helicase
MKDWRAFFPLDNAPREGQIKAIEEILEYYDKGIKNVVCDAPTGVGKSAIAVTVARFLAANHKIPTFKNDENHYNVGAYFLTTQKILQQQYIRDFESEARGGMLELKSSTNYTCGYDERQSCGESKRALVALGKNADGTNWKKHCTQNCVYNMAKKDFLHGLLGITNYSFFLAETTYVGKLEPRELLVLDECHNAEHEICKFIEVEITDRFCKKYLGINLSSYDDPDKLFKWMSDKYKPALGSMFEQVKKSLSMFKDNDGGFGNDEMFKTLVKQNDLLDKHICKVNRFIERFQPDSWIINRERRKDHRGDRVSLQFKPIDAIAWADSYLLRYGDKKLLMSATVLDKKAFCSSLGLEESKTGYLSLPSSFPATNRPIHYMPVGKMSMKEIDDTLPVMVEAIKELLKAHINDKGIIHTANFRVARYIHDVLNDPRLLIHNDVDRDKVLKQHYDSAEPTVLISPSMTEGCDFSYDLARFAIIAKLPYPSLGDKSLKKRIARDPWYYDYLTVRSFVQALGRGVRSNTDTCVTYILDSCFSAFKNKNRGIIPQYIHDAIK